MDQNDVSGAGVDVDAGNQAVKLMKICRIHPTKE